MNSRKRQTDSGLPPAGNGTAKRPRPDGESDNQTPSSTMSSTAVADLIAQKKREIAAKLQAANMPSSKPSAVVVGTTPSSTSSSSVDGDKLARQIEQIKARAAATIPRANDALAYAPKDKKGLKAQVHPALMVDQETGKLAVKTELVTEAAARPVTTVRRPQFATTKANERASSELMDRHQAAVERQLKKPATAAAAATINNPYLAHAATAGSARSALRADPGFRHIPKTFRFAQQGKYIEEAEQMRKQMELERLREEIAQKVKRAGLDSELDLVGDQAVRHEAPPEVEWWDLQFLPGRTYADVEPGGAFHQLLQAGDEDDAAVITNLIQHPVPIEPLRNPAAKAAEARPLMLTKREQKKMRRLRRMEVLNEKQEKIRLGLLPPDQPKLNLSNLMRVMGTEAVADPTTMEKVVRTQMKQRAEEHLRRNAEQQLTAEEKSEKKQQKLTEDITNRTHVAVFKIKDLSNPAHRFKITTNARQFNLSGLCLVYSDLNIVVVEGGPKALARYKALMMRRIKWSNEDDSEHLIHANHCHLVWEGVLRQPEYRGFRQIACPTEQNLKETLGDSGQQYFDAARNFIPPIQ